MTRSRISRSSGSRTAARLSRIMFRSRPGSGGGDGSAAARALPGGGAGISPMVKKRLSDLFLPGEFVDLAEDFLLHELELMQPDRGGDPDEEGPRFSVSGWVWAAIWGPTARLQMSRRCRSVAAWGIFLFLRIFWRISPSISGFTCFARLRMDFSLTVCTGGQDGLGRVLGLEKSAV